MLEKHIYHVTPNDRGEWSVQKEGSVNNLSLFLWQRPSWVQAEATCCSSS